MGTQNDADSKNVTPEVVLIHCFVGVSRSAAAITASLMRKHKIPCHEALALIESKKTISPWNFIEQLDVWGEVEYEIWEDVENTKPKLRYQWMLDHVVNPNGVANQ
jgi:protein-tyrosine phosphatase